MRRPMACRPGTRAGGRCTAIRCSTAWSTRRSPTMRTSCSRSPGSTKPTRRSLAARSEALGMQKKRFDVGDISEFDYRQLQADVAAERALLPVLELQRAQQENALAVLLGKSPRAIYEDALEAGSDPEDR